MRRIGFEDIRRIERELTAHLLAGLSEVPGVRVIGDPEPSDARLGVVSFTLSGVPPDRVAHLLGADGIAIRSGSHCAQPLHRALMLEATCRVSLCLYNTPAEIERFITVLSTVRERETRRAMSSFPDMPVFSAVITVPAMFETMQNEATKRAGYLAGFSHVVLLQEPIAAAMAYGFDISNDETWLIYDFGGGTFDAAVITSKEGIQTVIGHHGDNFSGGKDIDSLIVEKVIKPRILAEFQINNFDSKHYFTAFAKLKAKAEEAKIELSSYERVTIDIDNLGILDSSGKDPYFSFPYTRTEFNELIAPIVEKSIESSKAAIASSSIALESIAKVILVGGTTLIPYVRKRVEEALGIPVDSSVDPLTIVAKGAAIYGLGQRVPQKVLDKHHESTSVSEVKLTLNYDAMTAEEDELITGELNVPADGDFYIQISSDNGFYNSDKIKIKDGKFFDTVALEKGRTNLYWIYLIDGSGNNYPICPDSFSITHGMRSGGAPISHGIGVVYAQRSLDGQMKEACDQYFSRNSVPPVSETRSYKTARTLRKNGNNALPIKVYEGDSLNPELNLILTRLEIRGDQLPYDLLEGTDLDITIEVDESRSLRVEVYIPDVGIQLNARADVTYQSVDQADLNADLEVLEDRIDAVSPHIATTESNLLVQEVRAIRNSLNQVDDADNKQKAVRDIRNLKERVVDLEERTAGERRQDKYYDALGEATRAVGAVTTSELRSRLESEISTLKQQGQTAIQHDDMTMLDHVVDKLSEVTMTAWMDNPLPWIEMLSLIKSNRYLLTDRDGGEALISEAEVAWRRNDIDEMKRCVVGLVSLMPRETQEQMSDKMAGVIKVRDAR